MRLILAVFAVLFLSGPEPTQGSEDLLGDVVVEASEPNRGGPRLMKLLVPPIVGEGPEAELVDKVLRRDLDLAGQFSFVDASRSDASHAAEAIVRVSVQRSAGGVVELSAAVFFDADAEAPAYETKFAGPFQQLRSTSHHLVDAVIGALTGYRGPFVSRLTFVATRGSTRSVYVVDADGHGLRRITGEHQLASASAFGPGDELYYAASVNNGRYRLYRHGQDEPLNLDPRGSVYGIDFSPDRSRVAVTIAVGSDVRLYSGASDFSGLERVGDLPLAVSPAFAGQGQIAVAGTRKVRPRIFVDGRPASPRGSSASAPDFCAHPNGTRLVYALGGRRSAHIVAADARGRSAQRITRGRARNSHPACSPDGRLVAFFSTRTSGKGPGLYVMRIDGYHLRKIANVRGDSLSWARIGAAQEP